jgi:hypothetical protein
MVEMEKYYSEDLEVLYTDYDLAKASSPCFYLNKMKICIIRLHSLNGVCR